MLLDHPIIASRYFFPRREAPPDPFWVETPAGRLACHYARVHEDARTLVHFHGNGEVVADYVPWLVEPLCALGVNVLFAEFRGYGASDGVPALAGMLDDVTPIIEATGLPPERLVIFGRSVGSIYAIEAVRRHPDVWGLVLESGIADVLQRVLLRVHPEELGADGQSLAEEAARVLDHRAKLADYAGRMLVMHAEHDHLIDPWHAQRNYESAPNADKRIVIFPRGDHNSIMHANEQAYFAELKRFLEG